jgi:hypothetical protein
VVDIALYSEGCEFESGPVMGFSGISFSGFLKSPCEGDKILLHVGPRPLTSDSLLVYVY